MKLYHFRADVPNFGDELNLWLIPRIFPGLIDNDDSELLLAIGSVLFNDHPEDSLKIVFGSGFGAYTPPPTLDKNWKIYAVRGPRTAEACSISPEKIAGDTAILVQRFRPKVSVKRYARSFMPHWQSVARGQWQKVCARAGVHFIDPRADVGSVLDEIEASELVITEAMHGAIVADALRVPWISIMPFDVVHRFKWFDWAEALNVTVIPRKLFPSSTVEARMQLTGKETGRIRQAKGLIGLSLRVSDAIFEKFAAKALMRVAKITPQLSDDRCLEAAIAKLERAADDIRRDFSKLPPGKSK